jgi:hypothetical protein
VRVDVRRLEAKGLARAKARARRLRASRIRKMTFRGSLALFAVLWAIVFVQLVSGNDPALSKVAKAAPARHRKPHRAPPAEVDRSGATEPEAKAEAGPEAEETEPEATAESELGAVEPGAEFEPEPEPEPVPEPVVTSSS